MDGKRAFLNLVYSGCFFSPPLPVYSLCSVVPQTTVILNNDRQNSIVAKMVGQEEPLSRAADSLENILNKLVMAEVSSLLLSACTGNCMKVSLTLAPAS